MEETGVYKDKSCDTHWILLIPIIGKRIVLYSNNLTHINIVRVDWRPIGRTNPSQHDERRPVFPITSTGPAIITASNKIAFSNNWVYNEDDHAGITPIEVTRQNFDADVGLRTSTQRTIVVHDTQHCTTTAIRIVQYI